MSLPTPNGRKGHKLPSLLVSTWSYLLLLETLVNLLLRSRYFPLISVSAFIGLFGFGNFVTLAKRILAAKTFAGYSACFFRSSPFVVVVFQDWTITRRNEPHCGVDASFRFSPCQRAMGGAGGSRPP